MLYLSAMRRQINTVIVYRLWNEIWNDGNLDVIDEIFACEYGEHEKEWIAIWLEAFSDTHVTVEEMIATEDKVITRFVIRAVHQGIFWDIPPTYKSISMRGIWIHRLVNERIVEGPESGVADWLGLLAQLGADIRSPLAVSRDA